MPKIDTYLVFDGKCAEAMRFYEKALHGKLDTLLTHGESPIADQVPPAMKDRILHARLDFDGGSIMASDAMVGQPYAGMDGFSVSVTYPKVDEGKKAFNALADGGKVTMPFQKTFWAEGFGMLTDRYGTPWMVNCEMHPVGN